MSTNNDIPSPAKSALIIGGASGIGLTIAFKALKKREKVTYYRQKTARVGTADKHNLPERRPFNSQTLNGSTNITIATFCSIRLALAG